LQSNDFFSLAGCIGELIKGCVHRTIHHAFVS
jgi:hypothetical protein